MCKYFYCVNSFSNRCIRFCIIIQQRYSDIKAGHPVVMATTSIALAANFLNVFLHKRSSGKNLHREKGQSEAELTPIAHSDLRASHGHPDDPTGSRTTRLADALPRPRVDVCPIHLLSLPGDRKGARQQRTRQGRGRPVWEDEK